MKFFFLRVYEWGKSCIRIFLKANCSVYAAGLTYYSMLSIVPILCILLLTAKLIGVHEYAQEKIHEQIESFITEFEKAPETSITSRALSDEADLAQKTATAQSFASEARKIEKSLFASLNKIDFGTIGWIGFFALLWTAMCSISMIEISFNEIWASKIQRSLWKRYIMNIMVLIVLPLLSGLALTAPVLKFLKEVIALIFGSTFLTKWLSDGVIWLLESVFVTKAVTLFFSSLTFAFLFKMLPTCKVNFKYAYWCGLFTAVAFGFWLKICTIAQVGIARASLLYGSLALLPIILAWIYISWQIILFGCCTVHATHICMYADKNRKLR